MNDIERALPNTSQKPKKSKIFVTVSDVSDVIGKHTENMEYLKDLDSVLFVSASGVKGFFENDTETEKTIKIIKDHSIKLACLGEVTEGALKQYGLEADIVPKVNDVDGLVKAVINEL